RRLREAVREESGVTVHTSISYAREIATSAEAGAPQLSSEDLRMSSFGTTVEAATLARTISYFSLSYVPSSSPFGAIQGAVARAEFLYRQSTEPISHLALRGGIGLARFGP